MGELNDSISTIGNNGLSSTSDSASSFYFKHQDEVYDWTLFSKNKRYNFVSHLSYYSLSLIDWLRYYEPTQRTSSFNASILYPSNYRFNLRLEKHNYQSRTIIFREQVVKCSLQEPGRVGTHKNKRLEQHNQQVPFYFVHNAQTAYFLIARSRLKNMQCQNISNIVLLVNGTNYIVFVVYVTDHLLNQCILILILAFPSYRKY